MENALFALLLPLKGQKKPPLPGGGVRGRGPPWPCP